MLSLARSQEERRGEERQSAGERRAAGPTDSHKRLAAELGLSCETEWETFWDRVAAKDGAWFKNPDPAFSNWLRQEHKFAARDGRLRSNGAEPVRRVD